MSGQCSLHDTRTAIMHERLDGLIAQTFGNWPCPAGAGWSRDPRNLSQVSVEYLGLNTENDPFLPLWELDLTTRAMKDQHFMQVDQPKLQAVEADVTGYLLGSFSFVAIGVPEKASRLELESKLISAVSLCTGCMPSPSWLGLYSPKTKIRENGLWLVNETSQGATVQ
jgi:hypothetical protein